jgi:hypothetical protein
VRLFRLLPCLAVVLLGGGCARRTGVDPHLDEAYPTKLSGWHLFERGVQPAAGVAAYDVVTPLFSNYAEKRRTVWMPTGTHAEYRKNGAFEFPVGTILSKTFEFPQKGGTERLVETRLLVRQRAGWIALVYLWDRDGKDAILEPSPEPVPVKWVDAASVEHSAMYDIPNVNQCTVCHKDGAPLGPVARNVKFDQWTAPGYLTGAPAQRPPAPRTLDERARAYLDANCAPCHREGARAKPLDMTKRDDLVRRMETLDPEKRMPTMGRTVVHAEGVALIREWAATGR